MTETLLDFNADARDRLWERLERNDVGSRDQFKQSADTAGTQLEWFKPGAMGPGKDARLYAGPAVMTKPGTILVVLAYHEKAFSIWLRPNGSLAATVEETVESIKEFLGPECPPDNRFVSVIWELIETYGRARSLHSVELSQDHHNYITGLLFAATPMATRTWMVECLEAIIANNICPAIVGLLGDRSGKFINGAWPLVLPLAPYVEAVMDFEARPMKPTFNDFLRTETGRSFFSSQELYSRLLTANVKSLAALQRWLRERYPHVYKQYSFFLTDGTGREAMQRIWADYLKWSGR
jgi:hypothetical protein